MEKSEPGFAAHLEDLSKVLIRAGGLFFISTIVVFCFTPRIFHILIDRITSNPGLRLITTRPAEALLVQIKLAVFGGIILSLPVTIPIIWSYLKPALTKKERRAITTALIPSILLFAGGFAFSYLVIVPLATNYFLDLSQSFGIASNWTVSAYISLIISIGISFGIAFELPVVIVVLSQLGIVTYGGLVRYRKHVIIVLLVIAAILTPPDVVSQLLLAIPLYALYEFSAILIRFKK